MRKIFSFIVSMMSIIMMLNSCHKKISSQRSNLNQQSVDSRGNPMLLGKCSRKRLEEMPYSEWFKKNYEDYRVDTAIAKNLLPNIHEKRFIIFMGTWCGDSRREVPRMFKLLDYCGVKSEDIELIMLNSYDSVYKQSPDHEERGLNIHRVPDLLVFDEKKELGRIVESPVVSLEQDLSDIVSQKKYTPHYRIVPYLVTLFKEKSIDDIETNLNSIALSTKPLMSNVAELRSYGHVLMAAGEMQKALVAFELNALLYTDNAGAFDNLGDYYFKAGNKVRAKEYYEKSLQLEPKNENAKKMIEQLQ